jgi:hypothetical protein
MLIISHATGRANLDKQASTERIEKINFFPTRRAFKRLDDLW